VIRLECLDKKAANPINKENSESLKENAKVQNVLHVRTTRSSSKLKSMEDSAVTDQDTNKKPRIRERKPKKQGEENCNQQ
jgi:hypothetical protein